MIRKLRKGFTIVELVIVIAVIAVLTAVLIPTFVHLSRKAKLASDNSLVTNLNTALKMDTGEGHAAPKTMQDAVDAVKRQGYLVPQLATKSENKLVYSIEKNEFCLSDKVASGEEYKYWHIEKGGMPSSQLFSIYAYQWSAKEALGLTVGFDVGEEKDISAVSFVRGGGEEVTPREVVIRTSTGSLTVNAPKDIVHHYSDLDKLALVAIAGESYHEHGNIKVSAVVSDGHFVVESKGYVNELSIPTAATGVSVDVKTTGEVKTAVIDNSSATVSIASGAKVQQVIAEDTSKISGAGSTAAKENAVAKTSVSNESELKAALDAEKPYIVLSDNITVTSASEAIDAQGVAKGETGAAYKGLLLNYNVTIDGGNHKLTFTNTKSRGLVINSEGISFNLKNLTTKDSDRGIQMSAPNCKLVADGWVSESIKHYVLNVATIALNPDVTITNSNLSGYGVLNFWASGYSVYVSNSELYGVNNAGYNKDGWNDFGTVILEGDTTLETRDHSSTIDVNIVNSVISATTTGQGNKQWCILFNTGCVSNNVMLSGCTLVYNEEQNTFLLLDDGEGNSLYVDGRKVTA